MEIRTAGIPNVITLYTYDRRTLVPQEIECASGSTYSSNELFANVERGHAYTYQIGGRHGVGGTLNMLFNYAYRSDLTVARFFTQALFQTLAGTPDELNLLRLKFIGLTRREQVSFACAFCRSGAFRGHAKQGNIEVLSASSPPIINSRTRFIIAATSPAQLGRFKLYAVDVSRHDLSVISEGCLAPGVTTVTSAVAKKLSLLRQAQCPSTLVNPAGAEYVFWKSLRGRVREKWYAGRSWSRPVPLSPANLASAPAVAVHANGEQDVFWRGANGDLWETFYTGTWKGPYDLGGGGQLGSAPSVGVDAAGNQYVFWQGTDRGLWEQSYSYSDGIWGQPVPLNAGNLGSAPAVVVRANGEQEVFWRGTNGDLWETTYTGVWNPPKDLGGGPLGSAPTVGLDAAGNEYVFWEGTDGGLWHRFYSSGAWSRPVPLKAGNLGSAPAVAVHANGQQDVFWRGRKGHLWETWYTHRWNGPIDLGAARLGSAPSAGVDAVGKQSSG